MNLNKDASSWAKVVPDAFLTGSIVQARNVIEMAVQDIAKQDAEITRQEKVIGQLKTAFRVNMLRGSRGHSHEEISQIIAVCENV